MAAMDGDIRTPGSMAAAEGDIGCLGSLRAAEGVTRCLEPMRVTETGFGGVGRQTTAVESPSPGNA